MDPYNPFVDETYVKRIPTWKAVIFFIVSSLLVLPLTVWAVTVFLFQIDQFFPWLLRK